MIYINPSKIRIPDEWKNRAAKLTSELIKKSPKDRAAFIDSKKNKTWGDDVILAALRIVVGNKCWYSEVDLTGADPNIDHFRPKNRVKEIDIDTLTVNGVETNGYWWLAFEPLNFRLACMHSNQRRVDETTEGGKWDFFPVEGARAAELTALDLITERILPLDPCSATDVSLIWFGPDGTPGFRNWRRSPTPYEEKRLKVTIWLFHLDKIEISTQRVNAIEEIKSDLKYADAIFKIWQLRGGGDQEFEKKLFDQALSKIKLKIIDEAPFAGAKRCAIQIARSEFLWMEDFF